MNQEKTQKVEREIIEKFLLEMNQKKLYDFVILFCVFVFQFVSGLVDVMRNGKQPTTVIHP